VLHARDEPGEREVAEARVRERALHRHDEGHERERESVLGRPADAAGQGAHAQAAQLGIACGVRSGLERAGRVIAASALKPFLSSFVDTLNT
jgi:hypothetical protein